MKPLFICYSRCSTCAKAAKWLSENHIEVVSRDIVTERPTRAELAAWLKKSRLPVSRFFNTSGMKYRELNLKDKVRTEPESALLDLLATDGMLVKRPLLILPGSVLVGFRESEWAARLL